MPLAAMVCKHVQQGSPSLSVFHDAPAEAADTGFSVTCGADDHQKGDWLTVSDEWLFAHEGLAELRCMLPEGQMANRRAPGQPWVIEPAPPEEESA